MDAALLKVLLASLPAGLLLCGSLISLSRERTLAASLQSVGALCLGVVVVAHLCEALRWFSSMHWGEEHSPGHYLDLAGAILGFTLFPAGYLLQAITRRRL